jgi:hypothetical protein
MIHSNQTSYVRAIKINQTGGYPISASEAAASIIDNISPVSSSVDNKITISGSTTSILGAIIIEDDLIDQSSILYLGSTNTYSPISVSNEALFNSQINMTVGLVIMLVVIASAVSVIIMKALMNNLDEELI